MKHIIITGANGALGRITTRHFLEKGFGVTAVLSDMGKRDVLPLHDLLEVVALDLSNEKDSASFVQDQITRHQQIDGALFLAGGFAAGDLSVTDGHAFQEQLNLNFLTAFYLARPLFEHMKDNGDGRLVFIGARPALLPSAGKDMVAYSLAKSLLFTFAQNLNAAAKGTAVTATVIVPSTIDTPANRSAMPDADSNKWVNPEHLAAVMEWLFSEPASVLRDTVLKVYNNS